MPTEWVDLVHEATGHIGRVPDKPSVIAARRTKGWRPVNEPPEQPVVTDDDGDDDSTEEHEDA